MPRIESLLSARLFISPQLVGDRLYFVSNMSGQLSLYAMDATGSVPEPLLPAQIALPNPHLIGGLPFYAFPKLGKIMLMLDDDGDENYQPVVLPIEGGEPVPAFGDFFANARVHCAHCDPETNTVYLWSESRSEQLVTTYKGHLDTGALEKLGESAWGSYPDGVNAAQSRGILTDGYTVGDQVLYEWVEGGNGERKLLYGVPLEERAEEQDVPLNSIVQCWWTPGDKGLLFSTSLFTDSYGPGYMPLDPPREIEPVAVVGQVHSGAGEMDKLEQLDDDRYIVGYNIDGCSWLYEARFDEAARTLHLERALVGEGELAGGEMESVYYDKPGDRFTLALATATSPTQIYVINKDRSLRALTREKILGVPAEHLSPGEDASFTSFDGLRISARLYMPSPALGFEGPRPLVYYIHGGPQGQERPNYAWFSMPLIQFLALNGFAVFVPNVRGSTGYGLSYTKHIDRDWGGQDRLDHVEAMRRLAEDPRLDTKRAGVMGRSYGGYMTLTQATRHPELWAAAVEMFGPYDLTTFVARVPETWKPYFDLAVGHHERDRDLLLERSPRTYINDLRCPMLVIQGQNDPRVIERESRDVVEQLRAAGKQVEYLVFADEGHDVLKFPNRVVCYNAITDFFKQHLCP
ncbi:MAG: prolyl oligopeptidase family serine peptidase [Chloroflexia bacterium]